MPQPVNNNVATINLAPNCLVFVTASVQSDGLESVTITDANNNTVFQASGTSPQGGQFIVIGQGTLQTISTPNAPYTVTLTQGCAYMSSESTIVLGGVYYLQQYTFICNDGGWPSGDNDFNDLVVQITCFGFQG